MVDVPADHAVKTTEPRLVGHSLFKGNDEGDRALDAVFQKGRERPVAETEMPAAPVQGMIEPQRQLVTAIAQNGEPARGAHDHVELVTVQHAIPPPFGGRVHGVPADFDAAKAQADKVAQALVVISWNEHKAHALAHLSQQFLHHVVVRLRPVRPALDLPEVDDIADEVYDVRLVVLEQLEQLAGLRGASAKMHIRYEKRPHVPAKYQGGSPRTVDPGKRVDSRCSVMTDPLAAGPAACI